MRGCKKMKTFDIKDKKLKKYLIDNKVLDEKAVKKDIKYLFKYKDVVSMIQEGIDIANTMYTYKKYIDSFSFEINSLNGDYTFNVDNILYFHEHKGAPMYIISYPKPYDTIVRYKNIYPKGIKFLKAAIVESCMFSAVPQYLFFQAGLDIEKYLVKPLCFYDILALKKEYQDYDFLVELFKTIGFKLKNRFPTKWKGLEFSGMPVFVKG